MITRDSALHLLRAFFRGESPFEEVRARVGHASSAIPEVFMAWFGALPEGDRRTVVDVLAESIIDGSDLDENLQQACFVMVDTATHYPTAVSRSVVEKVERLFRQRPMIKAWLKDQETDDDDRKDFRSRWRFALALFNLLWTLDSPVAKEVLRVFEQDAKDPHFVRAIRLASGTGNSGLGNLG